MKLKRISFLAPGFQTLMVSVGGLIEEWSLHDPTIPKLRLQYLQLHNQVGSSALWAAFKDAPCTLNHSSWLFANRKFLSGPWVGPLNQANKG